MIRTYYAERIKIKLTKMKEVMGHALRKVSS